MGLMTIEHDKAGYLADFILYPLAIAGLLFLLAALAPGDRGMEITALALLGLLGLFTWTLVEYVLHHWSSVNTLTRQLKRSHALHHYRDGPPAWFGVTSPIWDIVLGTLVDNRN